MRKIVMVYNKINVRILAMLIILFSITAVIVSFVNRTNIRHLYEESFTERVLLTNALMASIIESEDVNFFVDIMKKQDRDFKSRQVRFYYDREAFWDLQEKGAPEEETMALFDRLEAFYNELSVFKTEKYWEIVNELRHLKELSNSTYLYIMADTGLINREGEALYTFIFDAEDQGVFGEYTDGLGTCDVSESTIIEVYSTKKQMDWVNHYTGGYGELYYAYAPILNKDGDVVAVFGTDLDIGKMNSSIASSAQLFNVIFLAFFVVILFFIFVFLRQSMTKPLASLTNTAHELACGNVYSPTSVTALRQRGEIGMLANAINDMSFTYQKMVNSTGKLFDAANIGKLDVRNDAAQFKGDIQKVIIQINDTLDATKLYLNSVPEGIIIMSRDLEIYFKNDHFVKYFGNMSASEFVSNIFPRYDLKDFGPFDCHEYLKKQVFKSLGQENNNLSVWIDGLCFSVILKEIDLIKMVENSILVIAIEITDLMQEKEKAQAAAEAKSNFLSNMSHEMRTPLNAIIGMASIGANASDAAKKDYAIQKILDASTHLLGVINDVLDMSKIEANKLTLSVTEFVFEKMFRRVVDVLNFRVDEKRQKLAVHIDPNIPRTLIGDDQRLAQVITNLLTNAVKFTPNEGSIVLGASLSSEKNGECELLISISDTGIGISPEQQDKLFNAFEQAEASTTRKYGGTGLGLVISKNIVEMMGGEISVKSALGEGSTFSFTACLTRGNDEHTGLLSPAITPDNIKVLVVDDDPDVLAFFKETADRIGITCDTASSGAEAFSLVAANGPYNVYFVDWIMPEMDGIEFARAINIQEADDAVIILVSAHDWNTIQDNARGAGINKFLPKPLFMGAIADCINECLNVAEHIDSKNATVTNLEDRCIMLAEDVEINREIVLALLEPTKLRIDCAANGAEAVDMFIANPTKYDLIFMDLQMPEMDGYTATIKIRMSDIERASEIPIVAMTANVFKEDIEKCLAAGMNSHIGKPLDFNEVMAILGKYL
ncbi:MAG: response regulator [Oscillospiraceae bacterium]|jgi:signal transduction histidine kinase/DNA-binding response OmpR family regulator/HAMP domain-containing protein|nr:response regulator [Oscillospiraceae bacterium]